MSTAVDQYCPVFTGRVGQRLHIGYDMERSCNRSILVSASLLGENCRFYRMLTEHGLKN